MNTAENLRKSVEYFYRSTKTFKQEIKDSVESGDEEKVLDHALMKAWGDAVIRERFNGKKNSLILQNKAIIVDKLKRELLNFDCINGDFDSWHKEMCSNVEYNMQYGVWQKIINMTFKYMYCVNKMSNNKMFNKFKDWKKCHCPIDSVIAKRLFELIDESNFSIDEIEVVKSISMHGAINWNSINEVQYYIFQGVVEKYCLTKEGISSLEFDFLYWDSSILQ